MKSRSTLRMLFASAVVAAVTLVPATAYAACALIISPNPGWRGADVAFTGTGFAADTGYYLNFGGEQIKTGTTNQNGAFSFNYTIPGDYPTGTTNVFATDNLASCEQNPNYTVNASAPTTTTVTTTTIPPTTTTTAAGTTTTTAAGSATTTVGETTTTVADTSTTTVAATDDGGGVSSVVLILLGALVGGGLVFLGVMMVRRRG